MLNKASKTHYTAEKKITIAVDSWSYNYDFPCSLNMVEATERKFSENFRIEDKLPYFAYMTTGQFAIDSFNTVRNLSEQFFNGTCFLYVRVNP